MLEGKRIIVTGSARGMGEASLLAYVQAGAQVVAMDINDEMGEAVVEAANLAGPGHATYQHVDISHKGSVTDSFARAAETLGGLDVLAHPAAIQAGGSASEMGVDDWDQMFAVNVRGTMLTNQAAYQLMKSQGGSIINFGSISGQRAEPSAPAYSAAKGAVHSWTRSAAAAWGAKRIRVNAILPAMATPMYKEAMALMTEDQKEASYWMNHQSIALGEQYGDPLTDLGPVMVFFASEGSRFITGQLIPVDGGQTNTR
jgi:3-oxoacyl-[acyl-carrier protein] reductase|tara:strand:- start:1544 stop:2314 length:771 start_codon:yes stop_codon:yes gene_type:complete